MVSFEWSLKNFCLAMALPTGPAPTPLLIIVKNIGIDIVQIRMKFLNSASDFHDHGKIVLKVHKIVPRGGVFVYFFAPGP